MQTEINRLIDQLKDSYEGDPWFGRNAQLLLSEVDEETAFVKLNGQHSILELVWHMVTWREFTINRLQASPGHDLHYFEAMDWRELDHSNRSLWPEGLKKLDETQSELITALERTQDSILDENVRDRSYTYRKLLTGIIQHDIYHLGQIAFITKAVNQHSEVNTTV